MFEVAELGRTLTKQQYRREESILRPKLLDAQRRLIGRDFSVIILIGGVDGAGKGETVNLLCDWMDSRGIQVTTLGPPSEEDREHPPYWRFWMSLPPRGRVGIFFGSWYTDPIVNRVLRRIGPGKLARATADILNFERQIADDGNLVLKFWFHLSREAQRTRLKELESSKLTRWRVTPQDWQRFKLYDRFRKVSELVLQDTSTGHAPWTVIEGADARWRSIATTRTVLQALEARLAVKKSQRATAPQVLAPPPAVSVLETLDMSGTIGLDAYEKKLEQLQGRLFGLARRATLKNLPVVVVYEGFDAAGKGGNIRRLTQGMDARNYRVVPVAAPTDEELARPYLWRFWRALGRRGRITIFDRSWYGRVLVERVEGFCSEAEWRRAYAEINEFEEQLHRFGYVIVKYWIHVTKEEQLRRFKERQRLAYKRFKITDEDWRNRKQWGAYVSAVDEIVARTSTPFAPWTLVAGNSKSWARIKTLEVLCERLEKAL